MFFIYLQIYFVTIATILGTGVLALPTTLVHAGLYPFLLTFIFGFLMQALLIYFMTDVLQRAYAVQMEAVRECGKDENIPLYTIVDADDDDNTDEDEEVLSAEYEITDDQKLHAGGMNNIDMKSISLSDPDLNGHILLPSEDSVKPPNLHMLGEYFLVCGVRQFFNVTVMLMFIAILVSYALAGSEAFAQLFHVKFMYVIPLFVWVLTLLTVFALKFIQPFVSLMTFFKGSLLLGTVVVTFSLGTQIHNKVTDDFTYIGEPFLMGTVALGGVFQTMPMLYEQIKPIAKQVQWYRRSVVLGIATCTVLNILWCWAVLEIVPQTTPHCGVTSPMTSQNTTMTSLLTSTGVSSTTFADCLSNISLELSAKNGEISTKPLADIIILQHSGYTWIALLIEIFIMISITVSYLTIGAAMRHTVSGFVDSYWSHEKLAAYKAKLHLSKISLFRCCSSQFLITSALSLLLFTIVFSIAIANPKGFLQVLEKFASFTLNLQSGVFMFLMVRKATNPAGYGYIDIPSPLPKHVYYLHYLLPLYFGFAVIFDVYLTIKELVGS